MKEIFLKPDPPLVNYVDIRVLDEKDNGELRERCKVTCDFGKFDVEQLKKQGLDYEGAIKHYQDWLYSVIKVHLASDWEARDGYEEVMDIIRENVGRFY